MHTTIAILILALVASPAAANWQLVWQDEFNDGGHSLDHNWIFESGGNGWGNNELEFYTGHRNENVRVENGHLIIDVRVEPHQGRNFTSGRMHSRQAWAYGRFEARARLPRGHHLWPAIWMMPRDSKYGEWAASGEIDIMEYRGDHPDQILGTIHYGGTWPNNIHSGSGERTFQGVDFSHDFHTFGMEWDHNQIRWYLDGHQYHQENINRHMWSGKGHDPYTRNGQPFDQPFFWILNVAVGGNFFGNGPYVTPEQARHWPKHTMEVDWLRVYQWK